MTTTLAAFVFATVFAGLLTPVIREIAVRFQALDHALSARKIHGRPVPRLGGIAIVSAFYLTLLGLFFWRAGVAGEFHTDGTEAAAFLLGGLCIGLLGVYDDLRGCRASQKFLVQFVVAGLMYAVGFRVMALSIPFGPSVELGGLSLPFTLMWIVGVTNAFNLIDGLDGLAGGVALIAVATNLVIALGREEHLMVLLSAALAGSILGFLFYNFNPASIFMGDTGSMFLGFVLGTIALKAGQKASAAVAILIPITALGLPLLDTALAVVRRAAVGRPIFHADREHIHHRMLAMGLTQRQAVLTLYVLSILLGMMAVALSYANSSQSIAILGGLGCLVYLVVSRLGYLSAHREGMADGSGHSALAEAAIQEILARCLSRTRDSHAVWDAVRQVAALFAADASTLQIVELKPNGETLTRSYSTGEDSHGKDSFRSCFRVVAGQREAATVEFAWWQSDFRLGPDELKAMELFCEEIGRVLGSVPAAAAQGAASKRTQLKLVR